MRKINYPLIILILAILIITGCEELGMQNENKVDLGRVTPFQILPSKCTITPGFGFEVCKVLRTGVNISIRNNIGSSMEKVVLIINTTSDSEIECNEEVNIGKLSDRARTRALLMCNGEYAKNDIFKAKLKIIYVKSGESLDHVINGDINWKIE